MQAGSRDSWWVICLCAAWCGVCRDWRPVFEQLARDRTALRFAWVDVEDDDEAMGDVEVETFPTLLIAQGSRALFLGPLPPSATQLARLVDGLMAQPQPAAGLSPDAQPLLHRLQQQVLPRAAL